jgi:hypothetical protein
MFKLPPVVPLLIGLMVVLFGGYRIYLAFRAQEEQELAERRGGLYGMSRRKHFLIGLVYVLMGGSLLLSAFGIKII